MSAISRIEFSPDLTDQVYQRLSDAICDGDLRPGARLTQEELAASLDVSRQPVLQALRLLRKDGFVIDTGRRGLMVAPLDPQAIAQIYQVRAVLDGLAAREAANARAAIDTAVIAEGRNAVAARKIASMIDTDLKFHNLIYAASGNPLLARTANLHWKHIRRTMGAVLQETVVRAVVWDEHEEILKAIARGDAPAAERLARGHGESAGLNLATQLSRWPRRAS
jgi:DNA-binding GntR family transcriptional regulator